MTGPLQDRADELTDRIASLSEKTEGDVVGPLEAKLEQTQRALIARWVRDFGSTEDGPQDREDAARFAEAARRRLTEAMDPDLLERDMLTDAQALAYDMGVVDATETAPSTRLNLPERPDRRQVDLTSAVDEALAQAILGLHESAVEDQKFEAVTVAMRRAGTSVSRIRATVAYEVTAAVSEGVRAVAAASDMSVIWVAERDGCLTCLAYAGATTTTAGVFPTDLTFDARPMAAPPGLLLGPPRHPHCFPAGVVASGPGVQASTSRWYEGELIEVRTRSGRVLPVTPNHPVLTTEGWVPAGQLVQGAQVVRETGLQAALARDPYDHQQPTPIEQVAGALRGSVGVSSVRMPVAPEDFHGDGTDGEVDVVRPGGLLRHRFQVAQPLGEEQLRRGGVRTAALLREGDARSVLCGLATLGPDGGVRRLDPGAALLGRPARHQQPVRVGGSADRHSVALQEPVERRPADAELVGQALRALASQVATDEVVSVGRCEWSGHVYNLETSGGWYTANGLIVHNCRCVLQLWHPDDTAVVTALKREAKRSVLRGWANDGESNPAKLSAAARLLAAGAGMPRSVEDVARRAVKSGRFPQDRPSQ